MKVKDPVETNWTSRAAVSAFALVALAAFCAPSLQAFANSTTLVRHQREEAKQTINCRVFAKGPAKLSLRKVSAQQLFAVFYSAADALLRRPNFSARLISAAESDFDIARGSLTLRERAPPV